MDLSFTPEQEQFRAKVQKFLGDNLPPGWGKAGFRPEGMSMYEFMRDWQRRHPALLLTLRHQLPADLGASVSLAAYRVVQEGLVNAVRHAQARHVMIDVSSTAERMIVSVADDGVGLSAQWSRPGHFGLRGLAERVEHLGGGLQVRNSEPHGVTLTAEIPLAVGA